MTTSANRHTVTCKCNGPHSTGPYLCKLPYRSPSSPTAGGHIAASCRHRARKAPACICPICFFTLFVYQGIDRGAAPRLVNHHLRPGPVQLPQHELHASQSHSYPRARILHISYMDVMGCYQAPQGFAAVGFVAARPRDAYLTVVLCSRQRPTRTWEGSYSHTGTCV